MQHWTNWAGRHEQPEPGAWTVRPLALAWGGLGGTVLLSRIQNLEMFGFTVEQVADLLRAAGFDAIEGQSKGLQWFVQATKPPETL